MPPDTVYETRYSRRERESSPSDDDYKRTTVRRYKVAPGRVERLDREVDVIEESRGRYGGRSQADLLEVDRVYVPERPRSAFETSSPRDRDDRYSRFEYRKDDHGTLIEREKYVERDDSPRRSRTLVLEHRHDDDDHHHHHHHHDKDSRTRVVYESSKDVERDVYSPRSPRDWERRAYWDEKDTDVRIEKRSDGTEVIIKRRVEERDDDNVERWRKETEYYEPAVPPIVNLIHQRPEQKIILQEAPPPAPLVIREQPRDRELVIARGSRDDDYYYRKENREVGPYYTETREEEIKVEHFDDDRHHHHHHRHHHRHHHSDGESDDAYYYKKKTVIRDRSRSSSGSPHRKRHIAEGALAGAGLSAILASRRNGDGELPQNRGRKVIAGAALGALGTEVVRRAHSAYEERYGDEEEEERERDKPHSRLKTGLGIAAVALAAAGAAKYYQSNKVEKEEMRRGRPRNRSSDDESSRSRSRKRSKSRASSVAKVAAGTAAAAALAQHYRHKRSKSRDGKSKSRSRSRIRTGAEIAGAALIGAGAKKLYDKRKDKKNRARSHSTDSRSVSNASDYERDDRYRRGSRSRSVSRSGPRHPADSSTADPELGMVSYGGAPLYSPQYPEYGAGAAAAGYESAAEESRRSRRRKKHRDTSRGASDYSADSEADSDGGKKKERKRSKSRLRDVAAGVAAAGAAAIGIKKYNDKRDKDKEKEREEKDREADRRDRERERVRSRDRDRSRDKDRDSLRSRDRERRPAGYEDETSTIGGYDDYNRPPSPPHASGGYYNPPPPSQSNGFTHHSNSANTNLPNSVPPYPGYVPPYPPSNPNDPANVSNPGDDVLNEDGVTRPSLALVTTNHPPAQEVEPQTAKSVTFIPLSPRSKKTLKRHREEKEASEGEGYFDLDREDDDVEELPERFNEDGTPLGGGSIGRSDRVRSRQGEFMGPGVVGQWGISGTDQEAVDRIVRNVTGVLEGRGSWLGVLGDILSGGLLKGLGEEQEEGSEKERVPRRRERGGDRKRRRSMGEHDRDDVDDGYFYDDDRKRRGTTKGGRRREWDDV
ncbi:hypothetical protein OQA88_13555 [Cercophora sp. LCS_1]